MLRWLFATFAREWPLIAAYAITGAVLSFNLGQDVNFDVLNYHYYNPFQLLNGRIGRDVLPAGVQTFFNPLLDLPFYLAIGVWNSPPIASA